MRSHLSLHDFLARAIGGLATGLTVVRESCGFLRLRHPVRSGADFANERLAHAGVQSYFAAFAALNDFQSIAVETRLEPIEPAPEVALPASLTFPHIVRDMVIVSADDQAWEESIRLTFALKPKEQSIVVDLARPIVETQKFIPQQELLALSGRWLNDLTHRLGDLSCFSLAMQVEPPTAHARLAAVARLQSLAKHLL